MKQKDKVTHVAYDPNVAPKSDDEQDFKLFWAIFNQKEEDGALYLVSSINNWLPIKLSSEVKPTDEPKKGSKD